MHRNALRLLTTMLVMLGLLTLGVAPAAAQQQFTLDVTFDQFTIDPRTGEVTVSGTITCSEPARVFIFAEIRQHGLTTRGFFSVSVACPGPEGIAFSEPVFTEDRFHPGRARLIARVHACIPIPFECLEVFDGRIDTTIRLLPAR
jgi:hypothetical protein